MQELKIENSECVIEDFRFDRPTVTRLLNGFVDSDLSPCAREEFYAHDNRTVELLKDALFRAVINEMVLRGLATHLARADAGEAT